MLTGTVHQFNKQKGYGFITPDDHGKDLFVHFSAIVTPGFKTLDEGQRVQFVEIEGKRGMQAVEVEPLNRELND